MTARHAPLVPLVLLALACAPDGRLSSEGTSSQEVALAGVTVRWDQDAAQLRVLQGDRVVLATLPGRAFLTGARATLAARESRGLVRLADSVSLRCPEQRLASAQPAPGGGLRLEGTLRCEDGSAASWTLAVEAAAEPGQLRFTAEVAGQGLDRLTLTFGSHPSERLRGFGVQYSWLDFKGAVVPVVVSEQGVGRGIFPLTQGADLTAGGAGGDWSTTYAAVPHLVGEGRSLYLENSEPSTFDLRAGDAFSLTVASASVQGRVATAAPLLERLEAYTAWAGRMRRLPGWLHQGAVVGMQGGTSVVRSKLAKLQAAGVPVTALWLQDWVGRRVTSFGSQLWWNWELDQDHYPGWDALVAELSAAGIRVLTYANPFLVDVGGKPNAVRNLFAEASAQGLLVKDARGATVLIPNTSFSAGLVDLSLPAARSWLKAVLAGQVLGRGVSGWMADFGEALPFDSAPAGEPALSLHNAYPERWAQLNREVLEESGRGDELVFFTRSGFTRSPGSSTLAWLGDQVVSWDASDGIKSAVTGMLSAGLSGFTLVHSDTGGYTTIDNPLQDSHRSPELLMRWAELSAFTPVLRTHEGNLPDRNAQPWDEPVVAHFARMAKVFQALAPYRQALVEEAAALGHPVARPLFLQYPEDAVAQQLTFQEFLLGTELLVAPVLDPGRDQVRVYLPAGGWVHLWTGQPVAGGWQTVQAPLGKPAVFFRQGSAEGARLRERLGQAGLLE